MSSMLFEAPSALASGLPLSKETYAPNRPPLLLSTRTVPLLQDDVLVSLFSAYSVELFEDASHLFVVRDSPVAFALLSGSYDASILTTEAHIIRRQWPLARIIVLGRTPRQLEDHLYDDTLAKYSSLSMLKTAFDTRSLDRWNQRPGGKTGNEIPLQSPAESDPSKAEPSDLEGPPTLPRDLPADQRQY